MQLYINILTEINFIKTLSKISYFHHFSAD